MFLLFASVSLLLATNVALARSSTSLHRRAFNDLGCWEAFNIQTDSTFTFSAGSAMSETLCQETCGANGFAGEFIDNSNVCHCWNSFTAGTQVDATQCNHPCPGNTAQICGGPGVVSVFGPSAPPSSSVLSRRRLRERLEAQRTAKKALCPAGLTACNVLNGGVDSFECIDTSTELESCGGCEHGVFGSSSVQPGIDCSTIPGVALGGVTCADGQCVVSACRSGLVLGQDGTCA